jgi:hypothetical protein
MSNTGPRLEDVETSGRPSPVRTRLIIAWVLITLVTVLGPLSVVTVWAVTTVTNSYRYVATMAPIVRRSCSCGQRRSARHIVENVTRR